MLTTNTMGAYIAEEIEDLYADIRSSGQQIDYLKEQMQIELNGINRDQRRIDNLKTRAY